MEEHFTKLISFFQVAKLATDANSHCDDLPLAVREWDCPNCNQHND